MSIWPIERDPLQPGEVEVSREQFQQLAGIGDALAAGVITEEEHATAALKICPALTRGHTNKLVVASARPRLRW